MERTNVARSGHPGDIERDHEHGDALMAITKGAPDVLLGRCTRVHVGLEVVSLDAGGEVVVGQNHLGRSLGHFDRLIDARMWSSVIQTGLVIAVVSLSCTCRC